MKVERKSIATIDREIQKHKHQNFYKRSQKCRADKDADVIRSQTQMEVKSYYSRRSMRVY